MKNLCGKCDVCCVIYRIDKSELFWRNTDKHKHEVCDKLVNNRCVVYKKRPKTCKQYECLWIQLSKKINKFPLKWRPDNLGLMANTSYNKEGTFLFNIEELEKGKINFNNLDPEIDSFLKKIFELEKQQKEDTQIVIYLFGQNKGHRISQNK